jgi:hypothetical protein
MLRRHLVRCILKSIQTTILTTKQNAQADALQQAAVVVDQTGETSMLAKIFATPTMIASTSHFSVTMVASCTVLATPQSALHTTTLRSQSMLSRRTPALVPMELLPQGQHVLPMTELSAQVATQVTLCRAMSVRRTRALVPTELLPQGQHVPPIAELLAQIATQVTRCRAMSVRRTCALVPTELLPQGQHVQPITELSAQVATLVTLCRAMSVR